jgi:alpha-L-fucosidase 2
MALGPGTVARASDWLLWYKQPAKQWVEALPIGNGRLGAMVFGGVREERLQLNEISLWSGGPQPHADRPNAWKHLAEIRKLLSERKYAEAERLTNQYMTNQGGGFDGAYRAAYQTLGDLRLVFDIGPGEVEDFRRTLELDTAITRVTYKLWRDASATLRVE